MKLKHFAVASIVAAFSVSAFAQMKVEDAIKVRQAGYRFMGWNMGRINNSLKGEFNKEEVAKAANVIAAIANSGMGALYPAGSDKGVGYHETHLKPEFFQNQAKVGEIATTFVKEANELAKVAATGDKESVKAQYAKVGQSCKACHDNFRREDH